VKGAERSSEPQSEKDTLAFWSAATETVIRELTTLLAAQATLEEWANRFHVVPLILRGLLNKYGKDYTDDVEDPNFIPYQELIFTNSLKEDVKIYAVLSDDLNTTEDFSWTLTDRTNPKRVRKSTLCFPNFQQNQDLRSLFPEFSLSIFSKSSTQHYSFATREERGLAARLYIEHSIDMLRSLFCYLRDMQEAFPH